MADESKKALDSLIQAAQGISPMNHLLQSYAPIAPTLPRFELPPNPNLASEFYRRLVDWINNFDANLDQEHEVGVRLVNFGQSVTFHLQNLGFRNPSLISFHGITEQDEPVELIQHVSQISILLMRMKRQDASKPKRPIGFVDTNTPDPERT
jgi:hypothetical protein